MKLPIKFIQVTKVIMIILAAAYTPKVFSAGNDSCFKTFNSIIESAPTEGTWTDRVLDHFHRQIFRFNKLQTADVELIFCRLSNILGANPDLTQLPQTISKTDPLGNTISLTVSAPTETFATTNGYTAKAVLQSNSTTFMTLWWTGNGSSSKGYLIQGSNPMQSDGNTRLRYLQWDLTSTTEIVKILATQFGSSYLSTPSASSTSKTGGDHAVFARMTYDTSSKAITAQAIELRAHASTFKCVRTYFTGTLGGTISGYRPAVGTPEGVTETSTGGAGVTFPSAGMDGAVNILDATTTADHSGSPSPGSTLASGTFDHSCNDINSAGTTGVTFSPFAGNEVSYAVTPETVFPR